MKPSARFSNGDSDLRPGATSTPPRFDDLPEMVTVEEMAAFLRISRNAAYDLVKTGRMRSTRFGRLIRIPKLALLEGGR